MPNRKQFSMAAIIVAGLALVGCTANNPTVQADNAAIARDQASIKATTQAIATASTQPSVDLSPLHAQLSALNAQLASDEAKEKTDIAAVQQSQAQTVTQVSQAVAGAVPSPWTPLIVAGIGLAGILVQGYFGKSAAKTSSDNHAASIQTAITAVANSVPVSALPAKIQPIAGAAVQAVDAVVPEVVAAVSQPK